MLGGIAHLEDGCFCRRGFSPKGSGVTRTTSGTRSQSGESRQSMEKHYSPPAHFSVQTTSTGYRCAPGALPIHHHRIAEGIDQRMPEEFVFFWSGPFSQWAKYTMVIDGTTYVTCEQ